MTITENVYEAKTHLSRLIERVLSGDEVIIARAGHPVACLVPYHEKHAGQRIPGSAVGEFVMTDDFEQPLPDGETEAWEA